MLTGLIYHPVTVLVHILILVIILVKVHILILVTNIKMNMDTGATLTHENNFFKRSIGSNSFPFFK
ncbi:MAG: hypothetical protein NWE89_09700 [Candidatus Bathyarchaeota archaeon]|nr:hypothetical protein [Candidatus Bathyarchaeota archaeon]